MQLVPNQCAGARMAIAWQGHGMAWHGHCMAGNVGATAVSPGRLVACCLMSVARSMLRVACASVCVCVLRSRVGAAIGCRLAALGVHSAATGRCRCPLHERVALAWLPCRRAAMRRSSPSWCSSEPTWRCRTPSGVLLDRAGCTMQQTPCKRTPCKPTPCSRHRAVCNRCPRPSHVQGA
jgi:hypothetical protein